VGQAAQLRIGQEGKGGVRPFTPAQGIRALEQAISRNLTQSGPIEVSDWNVIKQVTRLGPSLEKIEVQNNGVKSKRVTPEEEAEAKAPLTLKQLQGLQPAELREELGGVVRRTLRRTLGLDSQDVIEEETELSDLGVDSLMAMELRGSLQEIFPDLLLPLQALQDKSTLRTLLTHLTQQVNTTNELKNSASEPPLESKHLSNAILQSPSVTVSKSRN